LTLRTIRAGLRAIRSPSTALQDAAQQHQRLQHRLSARQARKAHGLSSTSQARAVES
jgi:hypothetical protein